MVAWWHRCLRGHQTPIKTLRRAQKIFFDSSDSRPRKEDGEWGVAMRLAKSVLFPRKQR
jgi:hypothetical protein